MALDRARHIDIEEMDLVVASDLATRIVVDEKRLREAWLTRQPQGQRARDHPQPELTRSRRHRRLDRAVAMGLGDRTTLGRIARHECEVLG